jgi:hypothetical protein
MTKGRKPKLTEAQADEVRDMYRGVCDKNAEAGTESFTSVYSANRDLFVRVRFGNVVGPIKTVETSGVLTGDAGERPVEGLPHIHILSSKAHYSLLVADQAQVF